MKAEKMNIEVERTAKEKQRKRLISYRDKLREVKDTDARKEGNVDVQGRE